MYDMKNNLIGGVLATLGGVPHDLLLVEGPWPLLVRAGVKAGPRLGGIGQWPGLLELALCLLLMILV